MSIKLRIVEAPTAGVSWYEPKPGDCWPCVWDKHKVEGRAPCWVVRLPGGGYCWHTNEKSSVQTVSMIDGGKWDPNGPYWAVTGDIPNITVVPSINIGPEIWHGWIKNGELDPETDSSGRR